MSIRQNTTTGRRLAGRLEKGADLLRALAEICRSEGITGGRLEAIGAVTAAVIGYYDQEERRYRFTSFPGGREIVSLTGNVSLLDGEPMVHAHIALADREGRVVGGHLAEGTTVFACEYLIEEHEPAEGDPLTRSLDEATGLKLWM
ncbi:PPC domain-containing DNA-binding protein [Chlorobium sp. N1]|uniref:PPC domain-containing DNA-binding protein n=1 Tax=Chlorobium sp. N1 TaxID=2491138 RepID=UPI00103DB614|nr:PPC domain-containing DNA-binding protein [Chlorobium sp. N1]TCD48788.1 DNA-binding protein [Chlorobium sp. N1]